MRALGTAVLASAILLTGLLAASSASAQTTNADGSKTIWSTTMTVGTHTAPHGLFVQVLTGFGSSPSYGSIVSSQITYSGTNYSFVSLARVEASLSGVLQSDRLLWNMPSLFPTASDPKLVLELDGTKFFLADASRQTNDYGWNNHGLNWSENDMVAVKLIELQPPSAPRYLRAKGYSAKEILLSWRAPDRNGGSPITGYKIEVSTDGVSNWSTLAENTNSTTYSHTGLTLAVKRYYRVSAINAIGTGSASSTASAISEPDPGRRPRNVRAKAVSMTQIDLSWSRPKTRRFSVTGYKIEVSRGSHWAVLKADTESTSTRHSHTGLRAGHGWFYRVSAITARDTSPASKLAFARTTAPPPSVPETVVPSTWSLIPPGLGPGDKFRLLFVTATSRQATSSNIEDYNSFVQAAASANADLASYSSTFRVVGSTQGVDGVDSVDARINTAAADAKVPVYWLGGLRVAEGHWDFYGNTFGGVTWDNAGNGTKSNGTSFGSGYVFTGSVGTGRLHSTGGLGGYRGNVVVGNPSRRPFEAGGASALSEFPFYGLSGVFQVDPSSEATVQPVLWVSDSTGYEFRRAMFFSVTLDPPATETVTVDYSTVDGSAEAGTDYTATSGTLTFRPGQAWSAVRVVIIDDSVNDSGQTFKLVLSNASNATIADSEGLGKIFNSDPNAHEVSIAAGTSPVTEGTEAEFTLSRTEGSTEEALTVTVEVTESGAMIEGTAPAEVTFAAGAETATLTVATADDEAAEEASAVTVTVVAGEGYGVAANGTAATVTVADDDAAPVVTTATALAAPENGTAVATLAATDADTAETELQWSIAGGADAGAFTLSGGGVLAFAAAKDYEEPDDADTDGVYAVTVQVTDGANSVEAALTVSLTDVYERAPAGTVWSAKMTVVEYGAGAVGAATADLFAHQIGSANLRAKWLWYQPSERKLRLAFDAGLTDAEALTLHLGETTLSFPENSGGDSSFGFEDVDIAWTDGQTLAVRVMDPSAEAAETVTGDGAAPVVTTASPILAPENGTAVAVLAATDEDTDVADLTWETAGGADEERFTLSAAGVLAFAAAPDFEAPDDAGGDGDYEVKVRVSDGANVTEAALTVRLQDVDDIAPVLSSATVNGTVLTLAWSEPLDAASQPAAGAFTVTVGTAGRTVSGVAVSGSAVTLTLASAVAAGETVTVSYTVPAEADAARIEDAAGNDAAGLTGQAVANETPTANEAPTGAPSITGTAQVGEVLTALISDIEDGDGLDDVVFAYQWLANDGTDDTEIAGATGATHEVAPAQVGKTLKVRVTFTDDGGTEEVLTSVATEGVVDRRPVAATLSVGAGAAEAGRFRLRIAFGDAVTGLALADVTASRVAGDAAAVTELAEAETGRAWTAWVAAEAGRYTVRLAAGAAGSGERRRLAAVLAVDVDAAGNATAVAGPVVTSVALATAPDGTWTDGETVRLSLTFSEPVTVVADGGTPTVGIGLDGTARRAAHAGGTGRLAVFSYTVTADDGTVSAVSVTADSLALNGGTIRDAGGRDADIEHPGLGEAAADETETESAHALTGLVLVDTASGTETTLADGDALVLADPANGSYGLVASVAADAGVGSVVLELTGAKTATATDDAAPFSLHGNEDGTVTGAGLPAGSYTLKATAYPQAAGGGAELGTLSVSFSVAASEAVAPDALTASFEGVPASHGGPGSEAFTFRVRFNLEPRVSYKVLRDESFAVTGGEVRKARRVDGRNDLREIHVEPEGWDDVRVMLAGGRACGTEGAICTADGKVLANTAVALVPGPLALSVADARIDEAAGAVLAFRVTLNRAASGTVTVDYATADGTATAGADYTATSGKLTFDPGETAKTVNVTVLDDAHDDTEETLTLTLSNATGARIRDGEATGTIVNSDPIPQAWLARFGRTVADHVVDAVGERLKGSPGGGSQVTLGGQRIPLESAGNGASPGGTAGGDTRGNAATADNLAAFGERVSGVGEDGAAWARWGGPGGGDAATGRGSRGLTGRELLLGSSFLLAAGGDGSDGSGMAWAAWGRAAASRFDGKADGLSVDGDVTTFTLGADAGRGRWLGGMALAHSTGEGGFRDHAVGDGHPARGSGELESTLTSMHPYLRFEVSERLSTWGILGYGSGDLTLAVDAAGDNPRKTWKTDTSMWMAAAGARGVLVAAPDTGGFELAARGDARLVRMSSDAATGAAGAGPLEAAEAETSRLRLILEGSHRIAFAGGQTLTPSLEIGLRHDGGDAETGTGVELGGGIAWADPALGLTVTAKARGLIAHQESDYAEWGASGSVRIDPGASGRGLALTLTPAWGADSGNAEQLWGLGDARGLAGNDNFEPAGRLDAEAGWGFGAFGGRGLMTPFAGLSLSDAGNRTWRSGVRWTVGPDLSFGVEGALREAANDNPAEHEIGFRLTARW